MAAESTVETDDESEHIEETEEDDDTDEMVGAITFFAQVFFFFLHNLYQRPSVSNKCNVIVRRSVYNIMC